MPWAATSAGSHPSSWIQRTGTRKAKGLFDLWRHKTSLGDPGPLAQCETVEEIERAYEWPSLDYVHLDETIAALKAAEGFYRAGGYWAPFFHDVADLFGFEELLIKMHTHPHLVEAAFERVCTFYLEANARLYDLRGRHHGGVLLRERSGDTAGIDDRAGTIGTVRDAVGPSSLGTGP